MPVALGYKLSSEEHGPRDLVRFARMAERAGLEFALISDHFHPWTDRQGQSPFAWSVIGGVAQVTDALRLGTGVTCPTTRIHPAIVAQAAATSACMMPGRFFLGVGSGELLNEHVVGGTWPEIPVRQERLAEAIEVIRMLLRGGERSHHGRFYTVENARIYTLPDEQIPIYVAVAGAKSARLAAQLGDGIVATAPDADSVRAFEEAGGRGPRYAEMSVCFAEDEEEARRTALEIWGYSGLPSPLTVELRRPAHFEKACELVTEERIAEEIACGPDVGRCVERIEKFVAAGFDYLCLHQIGPDQEGFLRFVEQELRPRMQAREERAAARAPARTAASGGDGANDDAFARRPPADS